MMTKVNLRLGGTSQHSLKTLRCEVAYRRLRRRVEHRVAWDERCVNTGAFADADETTGETLEVATARTRYVRELGSG
jgi:hypothetical protein